MHYASIYVHTDNTHFLFFLIFFVSLIGKGYFYNSNKRLINVINYILYFIFDSRKIIYLQIPAFLYNDKILSRYFPIISLIIDEK